MTAPGGYQRPTSPAPVSGPGALSRRTDGGPSQPIRDLPDAKYGENAEYVASQQGAPLAKTGGMPLGSPMGAEPGGPVPESAPQMPQITGFNAPTSRPEEPVTAGSAIGPGPGPNPTMQPMRQGQLSEALAQHFAEDDTGYIRLMAEDLAELGL